MRWMRWEGCGGCGGRGAESSTGVTADAAWAASGVGAELCFNGCKLKDNAATTEGELSQPLLNIPLKEQGGAVTYLSTLPQMHHLFVPPQIHNSKCFCVTGICEDVKTFSEVS